MSINPIKREDYLSEEEYQKDYKIMTEFIRQHNLNCCRHKKNK